MTADSLQQFRSLKLIATRTTGFDHIDIDSCREKGIIVCNISRIMPTAQLRSMYLL